MLRTLSIPNPAQAAMFLQLSLCDAAGQVRFGDGIEIELAFAGGERAPPPWVQLLPAPDAKGRVTARDGRVWTLADPEVVVAHFKAGGVDLPLDLLHATELKAPKGEEAPAQAWVNDMQVRPDRTVWGKVEWLAAGAAAVISRSYRYLSPAILSDQKTGAIVGLKSAGLVTSPALTMAALAGHEGAGPTQKDPTLKTEVSLATLVAAAGLAATASEADVITALATGRQAQADLADPTKFVPTTDLAAMTSRATAAETKLAALDTASKTAAAAALVDGAIADGRIPPASKDHWLSLAASNYDGAKTALDAQPKMLTPPKDLNKEPAAEAGVEGLTADQLSLCSTLGVKPADFAANLKGQV